MDGGKLWAVVPKWLAALGPEVVERGDIDPKFLRRVAKFAKSGANFIPPDERLVRAVMRNNCFLTADWKRVYKTTIAQRILDRIDTFPWPEDVLFEKCPLGCDGEVRECHFAHYGLQQWRYQISDGINMSEYFNIFMWMDIHPPKEGVEFGAYLQKQDFDSFGGVNFARGTLLEQWYLTHIPIVSGSFGKSREEQERMLPPEYEPASPIEVVQKEILFRQQNGRWGSADQGRCRTDQRNVTVGASLRREYLRIGSYDGEPCSEIGISASRNLPAVLDYFTQAELRGEEEV